MLLDASLDDVVFPAQQFCHDWMHALYVQGCFNTVMFLLVKAFDAEGINDLFPRLETYVAMWNLPKRLGSALALSTIFSAKRETFDRKAKTFKCQASDGLSVTPIIAFFLQHVMMRAGIAVAACTAFLHLADIADLLLAASTGKVTPALLRDAIKRFLDACIAAGWRAHMHPKFHWLIHLPMYLHRWGTLLSCFVHERKHKMVKRYSTDIHNTRRNEWSVLSEVTCHHIAALRSTHVFDFSVCLQPPIHQAPAKMKRFVLDAIGDLQVNDMEVKTASCARVSLYHMCNTRDVVLVADSDGHTRVAEVWFHASVAGEPCSLISMWEHTGDFGTSASFTNLLLIDADIHNLRTVLVRIVRVQAEPATVRVVHHDLRHCEMLAEQDIVLIQVSHDVLPHRLRRSCATQRIIDARLHVITCRLWIHVHRLRDHILEKMEAISC